jgi:hypothetical protein
MQCASGSSVGTGDIAGQVDGADLNASMDHLFPGAKKVYCVAYNYVAKLRIG